MPDLPAIEGDDEDEEFLIIRRKVAVISNHISVNF